MNPEKLKNKILPSFMAESELYLEDLELIKKEISNASTSAQTIKIELLKHYLLNYILYINLMDNEKQDSPIRNQLTKLSVLLEKLSNMENKIEALNPKRIVDRQMMRNKDDSKKKNKNTTPRAKYQKNAEKQKQRTMVKEDFNITTKKAKLNKFKKTK